MRAFRAALSPTIGAGVLLVLIVMSGASIADASSRESFDAGPLLAQTVSARSGDVILMTEWWMTGDSVLRTQLSASPSSEVPAESFVGAFLRKPIGGPIAATTVIEVRTARPGGGATSLRLGLLPAIEWTQRSFSVFAGGGIAQVLSDDRWKQTQSASVGWRLDHRALRLELAGRFNRFERTEIFPGAWHMDPDTVLRRDPTVTRSSVSAYRDMQLSVGWSRGRFASVTKLGGRSSGDPVGPRTFGGVDAAWQMTSRWTLLAGYAFEPSVPEEGVPARRAARAGVRVNLGRGARAAHQSPRELEEPASFRVGPTGSGRYVVSCRVLDAHTVEISGDFCDWQPRAMTRRGDGWWTDECGLEPGSHRVSMRIDGGPWIAPPGLSPVRDAFGGAAGVFVVR